MTVSKDAAFEVVVETSIGQYTSSYQITMFIFLIILIFHIPQYQWVCGRKQRLDRHIPPDTIYQGDSCWAAFESPRNSVKSELESLNSDIQTLYEWLCEGTTACWAVKMDKNSESFKTGVPERVENDT